MDDTYDVVVCGTGFVECILSGLLSLKGKWQYIYMRSFSYFYYYLIFTYFFSNSKRTEGTTY